MFDLAVAFATAASGLVAGSMLTLVIKRRPGVTGIAAGADDALSDSGQDCEDGLVICKESAPDDTLRCAEELGHWGWHRAGQASWWGATWGCDDDAVEPHGHVAASGEAVSPSTPIGPGLSRRSVAQLSPSRKVYSISHR
jgi:hypothetical protein